MIIREATQSDLPYIIKLLADDDLGKLRENFSEPLSVDYLEAFKSISNDDNQELIVLENLEGQIIGTMQLTFIQYLTYGGGIRAQIEAVRIKKDKRGLGVGKMMIEWAIKRAQERNAHLLQLTTDKKRKKAISFYENLDFSNSHEGMKMHFSKS